MNPPFKPLIIGLTFVGAAAVHADERIDDMDLKSLLDLEITSVAKKPQSVSMAAAAVHVITADDIRRSAARHIPDLLRTVPGISVSQISGGEWAITARGMNLRAANKLLVLVDGRSVYSPIFSGVYWDAQNVPLQEIERIEVVLGPGSVIWGANAVNGVINVITKSSIATAESAAEALAGPGGERGLYVRKAAPLESGGAWRVSLQSDRYAPLTLRATSEQAFDARSHKRLAWRTDLNPSHQDALSLMGEVYRGHRGESALLSSFTPPYSTLQATTVTFNGAHLLGRWSRDVDAKRGVTAQAYWDRAERDWPAHNKEHRDTVDIDLSWRDRSFEHHDLSLGLNYRQVRHRAGPSRNGIPPTTNDLASFANGTLRWGQVSAYVQDDWHLPSRNLLLTIGAKIEKLDQQPAFFLPNARLLWRPTEETTFWSALSRSVGVPRRLDIDATTFTLLSPEFRINGQPLPAPTFLQMEGSANVERLRSLEFGLKHQLSDDVQLGTNFYFNRYRGLRSARMGNVLCQPLPDCASDPSRLQYLVMPMQLGNDHNARTYGMEATVDWLLSNRHRLSANVSHFRMKSTVTVPNGIIHDAPGSTPAWMANLQWGINPTTNTQLDFTLRHVGALDQLATGQRIKPYTALDLRWSGRWSPKVGWFVTARNLGAGKHQEFTSEANDVADTLIGPQFAVGAQLRF